MATSAIGVATFGLSTLAEGAFDIGNAAGGGDEHTSAHGRIGEVLHDVGDSLGETVYDLIHPDE
jgi:hypothetical protein